MVEGPLIIGLGGSLSSNSTSLAALTATLAGVEKAGGSTELFSVRDLALPLYEPGMRVPQSIEQLCDAVEGCHGMIWSSPLYHESVSGAFKNAIDWLQHLAERDVPYLYGKVVGLVSTAGGVNGLQAINTMEFSVRALRGFAVPLVLPIPHAAAAFAEDGTVSDDRIAQQLDHLGEEVCRAAHQLAQTGSCDYAEGDQHVS